MRKIVFWASLFVLGFPLLVWSGGKKEESKVTIPPNIEWVTADRIGNPNGPITISFMVEFSYSHQIQTPSRRQYLTRRMEEWAKRNPEVKIIPHIQPTSQAERLAKQLELAASGNIPDAVQIDGQWIPLFYQWLQPLDAYFTKEEIEDWMEWCRKEAMIDPKDGKLKSIWMLTALVGLWYNNTAIPNPPKTWEDTIRIGKELKAKGFANGLIVWGGKDEQITFGSVFPMFYGLGGNLVDKDGKPVYGASPNRELLIEVLTFWDRLVKEGVLPQRVIDLKSNGDLVAEAAKPNNVAMFLGGSWLLSLMKDNLKAEIDKWSFTFTPQKTGKPMQIPGGHNLGFFQKDPKKLALIVDFMKYVYVGKDGMAGWCEAGGYTPVRKSVFKDFPVFSQDRFQMAFSEVVSVGRVRPGVPAYAAISEHVQEAWQNVILGRQTPTEAVDNAFRRTQTQVR